MQSLRRHLERFLHTYLLIELWKGLGVTGRWLFSTKFTVQYPEERIPKSPRFKGLHALRLYPNGEERCIACKLCEAICPAAVSLSRRSRRRAMGRVAPPATTFDLFKCIYCGMCEEACPVDAIVLTRSSEYHFESRERSIIDTQRLLAMGERFEAEIAADAPHR